MRRSHLRHRPSCCGRLILVSSQALAEDSTWHGWLDSQCQSPMAGVQNLEWPDGAPKLGSLGLKVFSLDFDFFDCHIDPDH